MTPEILAIAGALFPIVEKLIEAFNRNDSAETFGVDASKILVEAAQVKPFSSVTSEIKERANREGWAKGVGSGD